MTMTHAFPTGGCAPGGVHLRRALGQLLAMERERQGRGPGPRPPRGGARGSPLRGAGLPRGPPAARPPPPRRGGPGFGLEGFLGGPRRRGPRARRGDVRAAVLLLLAEEPRNGYAIMQEIERRTEGVWRPSPGAVYPALSLLEDEGLVRASERDGR